MKKVLTFVTLILCVSLVGCGKNIDKTATNDKLSKSASSDNNNGIENVEIPDEYLSLSGVINEENEIFIYFLAPLDYKLFNSPKLQEYFNNKKQYSLELLDNKNSLIKEYDFGSKEIKNNTEDGELEIFESKQFAISVPYNDLVKKIVIRENDRIIYEKTRDTTQPQIKITTPENNSLFSESVNVTWEGTTNDDNIKYRLEIKNSHEGNGWNSFISLGNEKESNVSLNSGINIIRVAATDGLNTSYDTITVTDNSELKIEDHSPHDKQGALPTNPSINIKFNNDLNPETVVPKNIQILEEGKTLIDIKGELELTSADSISYKIGELYSEETFLKHQYMYKVRITTGFKDIFNDTLDEDYEFTFYTN